MKHTLVFHLIGLSKKLQRSIGLKSQTIPLSYSQAAAMLVIDSLDKTSQIEIARKLHLQPASIVTLIDELERLKLVERHIQPANRRTYQIKLTDPGKAEIIKVRNQTLKVEVFIKSQLTGKEYQSFISIIEKLSQGLDHIQAPTPKLINRKEVKNELPSTKRHVAPRQGA